MNLETTHIVLGADGRGQDSIGVIEQEDAAIFVLADGAGGSGDGLAASEAIVADVKLNASLLNTDDELLRTVQQLDFRIAPAQSTAIIIKLAQDGLSGVSVGDSEAKIYKNGALIDLTENQVRKPLLGSTLAQPTSFSYGRLDGILIIASDGFWNYIKEEDLLLALLHLDFPVARKTLSDLARMKSGALQDDLSLIMVRERPIKRSHKVYKL